MRLAQSRKAGRTGFTLIELLVVIAIIALLVSLTTAGVMKWLSAGPRTETISDIRQLEAAIAAFKQDFNLSSANFPSRIKLCENLAYYDTTQKLDQDSIFFLLRLFPRMRATWADPKGGIDWNGNGKIDPANAGGTVILEGDQCLVFFLGGIPNTLARAADSNAPNGCLGFSRVARNPSILGGDRKGPYFQFKSNRLFFRAVAVSQLNPFPANPSTGGQYFFSYQDAFSNPQQPILYFSSNRVKNGYNPYFDPSANAAAFYHTSDCATVLRDPALKFVAGNVGVWPYATSPVGEYLNPNSFQLISAGENHQFGPGTDLSLLLAKQTPYYYNPNTAAQIGPAGDDDLSNFSGSIMGAGQ